MGGGKGNSCRYTCGLDPVRDENMRKGNCKGIGVSDWQAPSISNDDNERKKEGVAATGLRESATTSALLPDKDVSGELQGH